MAKSAWIIGIDEAGRGPLAGPVAVGIVAAPTTFNWQLLPKVADSKQLSAARREEVYQQVRILRQRGLLVYSVTTTSAAAIDRIGINAAIDAALRRGLRQVSLELNLVPADVVVRLDGGLRAPERYVRQETIIRGDSSEPIISLASIMAKVTRDQQMGRLATRAGYTPYDFMTHKGYGTKAHRAAIAQYGLSPQHRRTYCRNIETL